MSQLGTYTEESKLVGSVSIGTSRQGASVELSEDGNFLFVGGLSDNASLGAVWFYRKISGAWTEKQKILPTGKIGNNIYFGSSMAVNPSINTLIVGARGDNFNVGALFVFSFNGTTWIQQNKLVGNNVTGSDSDQGVAVALSTDADTAIVGGTYDGNNVGAAWIFVRNGNAWSQQGSKLVANDYSGSPYQGHAVALASDGNLAVVGGYYDQNQIGAIWIYLRSGTSWAQVGTKITATDEIGAGLFGSSLSLSGDDQTLVVGGIYDNSQAGAAWILKRNGNTFIQFGNKLVGTGATSAAQQGSSVAVNKLGTLVAVGAQGDSSLIGAVFIYYFNGTHYNQLGSKIVAPDTIGPAYQGCSVQFDSAGSQLVFGGFFDNGVLGAAWAYLNNAITNPPSAAPTAPTTQPSVRPTLRPSVVPTTQPSVGPTTQPSLEPTFEPSVGPSVGPTTAHPTLTMAPNHSRQPSAQPTLTMAPNQSRRPSLKPIENIVLSGNSAMETDTVIVIASVVGTAFVAALAYFFYRYRTNNKYSSNKATEISQWIDNSKNNRAADIQVQETVKNGDKFMAMTDIYGGNNNDQDGSADVNVENRIAI